MDRDRLQDLFEISIDEVAWRKGHRYLTLVGDHRTGKVVWGCDGKGAAAADEFFDALDRPPAATAPSPAKPTRSSPPAQSAGDAPSSWQPTGIMVPFGPAPIVPVGEGIQAAWLDADLGLDAAIFACASRLTAVSMDMTGGYAKAVRERAPQATIVIDNYHVVALATKALEEVRRVHWNELRGTGNPAAARQFKHDRWALLKNPADLSDQQATVLAQIQAGGGKLARAWTMKEMVRAIFAKGLTVKAVSDLLDRLLARLSRRRLAPFVRLGKTIRKHRQGILAARRLNLSNARAEALNNKVKLIVRRAYGFHSARAALALVHLTCGRPSHHQPATRTRTRMTSPTIMPGEPKNHSFRTLQNVPDAPPSRPTLTDPATQVNLTWPLDKRSAISVVPSLGNTNDCACRRADRAQVNEEPNPSAVTSPSKRYFYLRSDTARLRLPDSQARRASQELVRVTAPDLTAATTPPSTRRSVPVMKLDSSPRRKVVAATMSAGLPSRFVPDAAIIARIDAPDSPASSSSPIGVEVTPGLMLLIRAPRAPQVMLAACTRNWLARLERPYATPGLGIAAGARSGRESSSSDGVSASACASSAGSCSPAMVPAMLAITTPDPPLAITLPNSSSPKATPARSTPKIAPTGAWVGDKPAVQAT
jgi:Transposase